MSTHYKDNRPIFEILKDACHNLLIPSLTDENYVILDDSFELQRVCELIESMLSNGLKKSFLKASYPWDYLQNIEKLLPKSSNAMNLVKDCSKTSLGRTRAFIRNCLNDGTLSEYIGILINNTVLTAGWYDEKAFIRKTDAHQILYMLFESLKAAKFSLVVKDSDFERPNYYEYIYIELQKRKPNDSFVFVSQVSPEELKRREFIRSEAERLKRGQ